MELRVKNESQDNIIQTLATSLRNFKTQVRQITSLINNRPLGMLRSNTEPNSKKGKKEHPKAITFRNGKEIKNVEKDLDYSKNKEMGKKEAEKIQQK